jgi:hypothetical protein
MTCFQKQLNSADCLTAATVSSAALVSTASITREIYGRS